ncbi:Rv3235 family protein [Mycobacterium persicum]|uniref:Rv3235 family protein n=1 Tax=Mycobacterium persicum TaxID=1487726 RepID=UPI000C0825F3
MSISPIVEPPHRPTFAVVPVVEYEPPTGTIPRCRQSTHPPLRPRSLRAPRRARGDHPTNEGMPAPMRQAAVFTDAALRRVLEVIDRRRPAAQLGSLLAPNLVHAVLSVSDAVAGQHGTAVLRRVRLQPVGSAETAAEVFGSYSRGDRIHAIACRVERVSAGGGPRWLVVALHIG